MKKFLVGLLAAFMCLGCFTGCEFLNNLTGGESGSEEESVVESVGKNSNSEEEEENSYNLEGAKSYVRSLYKEKNVEVSADYSVLNAVPVSGVTYTITWSVTLPEGVESGVTVEAGETETVINVDEMLAADLEYVLTATIADPDGNTISVSFNRKVKALTEEVLAPIDEAPVENVAYILHTYQSTKQKDCYFNGKMSGYYFATSEDIAEAVSVYVEYKEGSTTEFYPYFMSGDTKQYIGMRVSSDGGHNNIVFDDEYVSVFVWNDEYKIITTTIVDRDGVESEFYLGNYATHMTISGSTMSHITGADTNLACLKTTVSRNEVSDSYKVNEEAEKLLFASTSFIDNGTLALPVLGATYPDVTITWEVEGDCATLADNTVTVTAGDAISYATLTATLTAGDETKTKEFAIMAVPNNEAAIVEAAYALPAGQQFASEVTLTGVITSVDTPYDAVEFFNVTVTMDVLGKAITCYRLAGDGADVIAAGYTITVSGIIKNFNSTIEFDQGCYLEAYEYGEPPVIETPDVEGTKVATFEFGDDGATGHVDGSEIKAAKDFTDGNYTLTINAEEGDKVYSDAKDETGKSCLKVGTSSVIGSFSFTVADDVNQVIIYVAKYKAKTSKVTVNGTEYTLNKSSNNGEYEQIVIDTSSVKTVEFSTVDGATRVMINTVEFYN